MKASPFTLALNVSIVRELLINGKCSWGTIPAVLSGTNRGKQWAWCSTGALRMGPDAAWMCFTQLGWLYLMFALTHRCICVCAHSWAAGSCISVRKTNKSNTKSLFCITWRSYCVKQNNFLRCKNMTTFNGHIFAGINTWNKKWWITWSMSYWGEKGASTNIKTHFNSFILILFNAFLYCIQGFL